MATKKSSGLKYTDLVAAQGGSSVNRQTGQVTTASGYKAPSSSSIKRGSGGSYYIEGGDTAGNAKVSSGATAVSPAAAPIAADALGASAPIAMPQPSTDTSGATAMAAGAEAGAKTIGDYIKEITPPETETSKQYNDILGSINNLLPELGNKKAEQAKVEKELGIPDTRKQLAELNGLMTSRLAEYNKAITETETAPGETPLGLVLGRQAVIRRNQAADLGLLQARGLALQGQLEAAQETANRAIDLKYGTMEDTINIKMQQLQLIQPILDKEERTYAAALERKYTDEREALAEKKAKAKENISLAFSSNVTTKLANRGGEWFRVSDGKTYGSAQELFTDFPEFGGSFEKAYQMGAVTDITAERMADIEFKTQLRAKYGDAGITLNDSDEVIRQKLQNSLIFGKENYIPQPEGPGVFDNVVEMNGAKYILNPATGLLEPLSDLITPGSETPTQSSYQTANNQRILQSVDDLVGRVSAATVGAGSVLSKIPGTPAANFAADLDTLKANIAFGQLQAMREASKTGGALGSIATQELNLLEATLGALSTNQSPDNFKKNLERIKQSINTWNAAISGADLSYGPTFNQAGNASASNKVMGARQTTGKAQPILFHNYIVQEYKPGTRPTQYGAASDQCGYYARKVVQDMGYSYPALGDGLNAKRSAVQKYGIPLQQARVGGVIVTSENPTYGHVAVITGKTANGFIVTESNFKQTGKISHGRVIPFNSPKIVGVINPTGK